MKQLNVTLMDLWTSPSEIHIILLELCVSEILFEFVQNQIWLNYFFFLGFPKLNYAEFVVASTEKYKVPGE